MDGPARSVVSALIHCDVDLSRAQVVRGHLRNFAARCLVETNSWVLWTFDTMREDCYKIVINRPKLLCRKSQHCSSTPSTCESAVRFKNLLLVVCPCDSESPVVYSVGRHYGVSQLLCHITGLCITVV